MLNLESNKSGKRYSVIFDYLRIFAMLGVFAVHFSQQFPTPPLIKSIAGMGAFCVQIFFVLSAYLGCSYFFTPSATACTYYKKRALRILPTYYAAIFSAMLYVEFVEGGNNKDIFSLGWLRYFLGLNTLLPSADFMQWNNAFGFWAMTNFISFYVIIPLVIKIVSSWEKSVIFFLACYFLSAIATFQTKYYNEDIFSNFSLMINLSPIGQMQHFALGIMTYFATKENRKSIAAILLILLSLLPPQLCAFSLHFSILTCLFIISVKDSDVNITGLPRKWVQVISKYSFHVYLTHLLGFSIAQKTAGILFPHSNVLFYTTKLFVCILVIFILCCFLELVQKSTNKVCLKQDK